MGIQKGEEFFQVVQEDLLTVLLQCIGSAEMKEGNSIIMKRRLHEPSKEYLEIGFDPYTISSELGYQ